MYGCFHTMRNGALGQSRLTMYALPMYCSPCSVPSTSSADPSTSNSQPCHPSEEQERHLLPRMLHQSRQLLEDPVGTRCKLLSRQRLPL